MLVVNRFRVAETDGATFRADLETVAAVLAACPGHESGRVGRNLDDPTLWTLVTSWADVGAYRRAIGSHDAKRHAVPLLSRAIDEPSAYETPPVGTAMNVATSRSTDDRSLG